MTENPLINALSATLYISIVAFIMSSMEKSPGPDHSVLVPIAMLSLFVLSAAIMGYIFCYKPIQLLVEGEKTESIQLFLKTVGIFASITILVFFVLFVIKK